MTWQSALGQKATGAAFLTVGGYLTLSRTALTAAATNQIVQPTCVCVRVRACMHACVCVVRACLHACVSVCVSCTELLSLERPLGDQTDVDNLGGRREVVNKCFLTTPYVLCCTSSRLVWRRR